MGIATLNNLDRDVWRMILDHLYVPDGQAGADHPAPAAAGASASQPEAAPLPALKPDEKESRTQR